MNTQVKTLNIELIMNNEYVELNMANYDEDQVCQLNGWAIEASLEIERLQAENERLRKERSERISRDCTMDEVDELMDCIHSDHTFEDLDIHTPADMQTTTGSTIAWLMHRCHAAEKEVQRLKDAKNPLFIEATPLHDAGAYARCSYCGRYSDNPKSLSHDISCECGTKMGWSGSFCRPNKDSKWSR